jgi:NAD(P)-dependent dehydrogenase (short-subunit alcohol dehydrogenase family)
MNSAPFFLTGAFAARMADNDGGPIVNVSTMVASFGLQGMALYGCTKAALELLTKARAGRRGLKGPSIVVINGMRKPHRTTFTDRDYLKHVRALGENHLTNFPRRLAA